MRFARALGKLISLVGITLWAVAAWAEPAAGSSLLEGLGKILNDPGKKMAMTRDQTLVVMSRRGEVSLGNDSVLRLHAPGTLQRMVRLSEGFSVNIGEALGHRERRDAGAGGKFARLLKDPHHDFKLRPDGMGFVGRTYKASERPMDIWGNGIKMSVRPDGSTRFAGQNKGPMGFLTRPVPRKQPALGRARTRGVPRGLGSLRGTSPRRLQIRRARPR